MSQPTAPKPRRRWFQFRLRTLLAAMLLVGSVLGWIARERRQSALERQIATELGKQRANVGIGGPYDAFEWSPHDSPVRQEKWRRIARTVLGDRILKLHYRPPIEDLGRLEQLASLRLLHLDSTGTADLAPLAQLSTLEVLNLSKSSASSIAPLAGLRRLQRLRLCEVEASDLAPLAVLTELRDLEITGCPVNDLTPLAGLVHLERLSIFDCQSSEWKSNPVASLTQLSNLKSLTIELKHFSDISSLAALRQLESLNLLAPAVDDATDIAKLRNLREMDLSLLALKDLAPLAALGNLRALRLTRQLVDADQVEKLRAYLPGCKVIVW